MSEKARVLDALAHAAAQKLTAFGAGVAVLTAFVAWLVGLDLAQCVPAVLAVIGGVYYWSLRALLRDEELKGLGEDELRSLLNAACALPAYRWFRGGRTTLARMRASVLDEASVSA